MKNSSDIIGNRARDLPACSAVPQPTALPRSASPLVGPEYLLKRMQYLGTTHVLTAFTFYNALTKRTSCHLCLVSPAMLTLVRNLSQMCCVLGNCDPKSRHTNDCLWLDLFWKSGSITYWKDHFSFWTGSTKTSRRILTVHFPIVVNFSDAVLWGVTSCSFEAAGSSETSVPVYQCAHQQVPENLTHCAVPRISAARLYCLNRFTVGSHHSFPFHEIWFQWM